VKRTLAVAERELREAQHTLTNVRGKADAYRAELTRLQTEMEQANAQLVTLADEVARYRAEPPRGPQRERLPDDRTGRTYKLRVGVTEMLCPECSAPLPGSRVSAHLTVNTYPNGKAGELFLSMDRHRRGELSATFAHQLAIAISVGLQYGIPLSVYAKRLRHVRDDSGGMAMREVDGKLVPCENPHTVGSLVDLIAVTLQRFEGSKE
jgi:hypothetical protein